MQPESTCLGLWFSNLRQENPLLGYSQGLRHSRCGLGWIICMCNKFLDDAVLLVWCVAVQDMVTLLDRTYILSLCECPNS